MKAVLFSTLLALLASSAHAKDINLPPQRVEICVGKSGVVMRTNTQLQELVVNGITSTKSTFRVKTPYARLTCDFDTAESIVARCVTPGTQVIGATVKFAYADPNRYHARITVVCKPCPGGGHGGGHGGGGGAGEPIPMPMPSPENPENPEEIVIE